MTDPYTYTDHTGDLLTVSPTAPGPTPGVYIETGRDYATNTSVVVPVDRLHDVIAGMLAQAAAAQGRTWVNTIAQARDDYTLINTPGRATDEDGPALDRALSTHPPLLLALAEAYTGQDAELWQQYARVQRQRDAAEQRAKWENEQTSRLLGENETLRAERDQARADRNKLGEMFVRVSQFAAGLMPTHPDIARQLFDLTAGTPASTAPLAAGHPHVQGRCPACGRASLFLAAEGYVTCAQQHCPAPDAATDALERFHAGIVPAADIQQHRATPTPREDGHIPGAYLDDCPCGVCRAIVAERAPGPLTPPDDATAAVHEAIVWTGDNIDAVMDFMAPDEPIYVNNLSELRFTNADDLVGVNTPDGLKIAKIGDQIARVDGRLTVLARP